MTVNFLVKQGEKLYGTICLPDGKTAPKGGTYVFLNASNKNFNKSWWGVIPEGKNSIDYSLFADPDGVKLCHAVYNEAGELTGFMYYSKSGETPDVDAAETITEFSMPINMVY